LVHFSCSQFCSAGTKVALIANFHQNQVHIRSEVARIITAVVFTDELLGDFAELVKAEAQEDSKALSLFSNKCKQGQILICPVLISLYQNRSRISFMFRAAS
jgi:predicted DNA-binding ArsR family transcriptional regulator